MDWQENSPILDLCITTWATINSLEYHNKALEINTEQNNRVRMAKDYYSLNFPLYRMNRKEEALDHLSIAKTILLDFHKETGYSHPLLKDVEDRLAELKQDKK